MKHLSRLPLYLGLTVFVLSVLVTSITLRSRKSVTNSDIRASQDRANLTLLFTPPDIVSLSLNSFKEVAGVDVTLSFDKDQVIVMPSSLKGGEFFKTTGGKVAGDNSTFNFTAIAKATVTSGIVATFNIRPKNESMDVSARMEFAASDDKTAVLDKASGQNILLNATGVDISIPAK